MRPGPGRSETRGARIRIWAIAGLFVCGFGVVAGRAVQLQVFQSEDLSSLARDQYLREIELKPRRGPIVDRNGVTLAADVEADSVFVDPQEFPAAGRTAAARRLAKALGVDAKVLEKRLARGGRFAWVKRRVSPSESAAARGLKLQGVGFVKEFRRYYPGRELGGQLLGVVSEAGEGQEGVERLWDEALRGESLRIRSLRDARGRMALGSAPGPARTLEGARVELTIDQGLQLAAERALANAVSQARAAAGMLVALDARTGEVLALANAPLFNPNNTRRAPEEMRNRSVLDSFEPGSTFKVFSMAGALEAGVLRPGDSIDCENGAFRIGSHVIHDHHGLGWVGPSRILASSSNIGAAKIGQRLGRERLHQTLLDFGFGERVGTGLPGEPRGQVPLPRAEIALATMSFGQGVTASPLQITAAMAAIANGGTLMKPLLVRRAVDVVRDDAGAVQERVIHEAHATPVRQVVSAKTAEVISRWLEGVVVDEHGTGKKARLQGWRAAGKTGTAQKADPVTGGYSAHKRFSSFVGFAPSDAPRIVVGVFIDEPKGEVYGGEIAAPAFREVVEHAMQSYGVPPTEEIVATPANPPAKGKASGRPAAAEVPPPPVEVAIDRPLAPGTVAVPLLDGLPARSAVRALEQAELVVEVRGSGRVTAQAPHPGQVVPRGTTVRLTLSPPG
ncbi:MAG TPA: penicillin-binding protein [Anaeromyxobacteraceae bacterium]|nr:penicillin-binding protein [Anaeromyxobacteraceae bacterium]